MPTAPQRRRLATPSLVTLACLAALAPAWAQEPGAPQVVEVTGSRLRQIDAEGVSPVSVISREAIVRSGATNVREALESLSGFTSSALSDIGGSNSFAPGASGAEFRNLGKQSTLVLLNGRRIAPYPLADFSEVFSNIDSLPLEVIDRIEVLKNGGSALYGSDAVAGVINIITRPTFKGAQIHYSAQKSLKNGQFGERSGGLTVGLGDYANDGWNVLGNIEMFRRDSLFWSRVLKDVNPDYAAHVNGFGASSTYSNPANIIGVGPLPGCTNIVGGLCRYDRFSRFQATPATQRINALLQGRKRIDSSLEWFSEALLSSIKTDYESAYATYGAAIAPAIWGDPSSPGTTKAFYYRGLPAQHPLNPTGDEVEFRYRFTDAPSHETADTSQYRFLTGLKGTWKTVDWESAVGLMGGTTRDTQRGTLSDSGFKQEIGDYDPDPANPGQGTLAADFFNKPGGYHLDQPNSAAVLDTLFPNFGYQAKNQQYFWDGVVRADIAQLPAGALQLATGFDLRHEQMTITPSGNLASGDIVGFGNSSSDGKRTFGAVFAEAGIPLLKTLDADIAGRLDKFPGFGAHLSPKAGLKFKPVDAVLLRGTFETGFRAPNLTESAPSTKFAFDNGSDGNGINDPKRCDQALAYATDLGDQADALADDDPRKPILASRAQAVFGNECGRGVSQSTTNNPSLKPETSKSLTFGLVLQPLRHWSTSIDYWNIHRKNEINQKGTQDLLVDEATQPAGVITRQTSFANDPTFSHDPNGLTDEQVRAKYGVGAGDFYLLSMHNQFENLFQTKTDGVDLALNGTVPTSFGDFGLDIDATYTHSLKKYSNARQDFGDNLAGRYGTPRWISTTELSYRAGGFSHTLRWVHHSRTTLQLDFDDTTWTTDGCAKAKVDADDCFVKAYNRIDYTVSYSALQNNLTVGLNVRNLLQKRPPVDYRAFNVPNGVIPQDREDVEGRRAKVWFTYKWL